VTQANRTLVTVLALLLLGGGFGLYAWYGVYEKDRVEAEKKDKDDRLFMPVGAGERRADGGTLGSDFVKLTVTAQGDTTVLERAAGQSWRIVSPVQAPADKVVLDAMVSQLQQSKFKRVIDENPSDEAVKTFGLDKPDFTVEAVAEIGPSKEKRTVKLEAGVENTYDGSIYMRRNGEKKVLSAEGGVKWTLGKSTFDLRDKEVLALDDAKLRGVEVTGKNNAYLLASDEKRNWKITAKRWAGMKAAGAEAVFDGDPVAINGALSQVRAERATAFPPDSAEARKAFDDAAVDVTFTFDGLEKIRVRLVRAPEDAGVGAKVLREKGADVLLAEIPGEGLAQLDRLPTDFRDKRLMPFKKEEVAKIVFYTHTGVEIVAQKASPDAGTADSWMIVSPKRGPAKTLKIASLLWTFGTLKQVNVIEENPKEVTDKYALDPRIRSVSIYDAGGRPLGHFEWGKEVPGTGNAYMRGTRGDVVEGEVARLTDFPKTPDDLIDAPVFDAGVWQPDAGPSTR
jgi:Domain of unknown function (DUF4340)